MKLVDDLTRRIRHLPPAQRDPYHEVVASIAAMHPSKQFGEATVRVYVAALKAVPLDELREVVWDLIKTRTFPPTVAEILAAVAERRLDLPEPMAAWELVCDVISKRSGYNDLPSPVLRAAEAVGGPWTIRQTDNEIALRAHFLQAYREFRQTDEREAVLVIGKPRLERKAISG